MDEFTSHSSASLRVLVADDNRDAADSLAMLLEAFGHVVEVAYDGSAAIESAKNFHPDAALLDLGMPLLDGHEVARQIRNESWGKSLVLVALTGWAQAEDRQRTTEAGFDHHLVKPANLKRLQEILASIDKQSRPDG